MKRILGTTLVSLAAMSTAAQADDDVVMSSLEIDGLTLTSAEYWPYHADREPSYPDEVLWGFYPKKGEPEPGDTEPNPDTATPQAVACATKAWLKLKAFMETEQPVLKEIIRLGADQGVSAKFYLWTNDYSDAVTPFPAGERKNRLWYWKRNPPVPGRTPGYWKWESTLLQDGTCLIPEDAQIKEYLQKKLDDLRA